jgi:hypothetical protein
VTEEYASMLMQVHYWLHFEYSGEYALPNTLKNRVLEYKETYDANPPPVYPDYTELRWTIEKTLDDRCYVYEANWSDFPYRIDYAQVINGSKQGVFVDDDNAFLRGSDNSIRSGKNKVKIR